MPRVWESYSLYGDGNETCTTRLYLDRTDDRSCDRRYFGGNRIAGVSGLRGSLEDVGRGCSTGGVQDFGGGICLDEASFSCRRNLCGLFYDGNAVPCQPHCP